jgi:hypothetical protein
MRSRNSGRSRLAARCRFRSGSARAYGHDHGTKRLLAHRGHGCDDHRPDDLGSGRHDLQRELFDLSSRRYRRRCRTGRVAMDSIDRDVQMAGFRGCNSNNVRAAGR